MIRHAGEASAHRGRSDVRAAQATCATASGPPVIAPLAEALSAEQDARSRRRLRDILVGFGAARPRVRSATDERAELGSPPDRRVTSSASSAARKGCANCIRCSPTPNRWCSAKRSRRLVLNGSDAASADPAPGADDRHRTAARNADRRAAPACATSGRRRSSATCSATSIATALPAVYVTRHRRARHVRRPGRRRRPEGGAAARRLVRAVAHAPHPRGCRGGAAEDRHPAGGRRRCASASVTRTARRPQRGARGAEAARMSPRHERRPVTHRDVRGSAPAVGRRASATPLCTPPTTRSSRRNMAGLIAVLATLHQQQPVDRRRHRRQRSRRRRHADAQGQRDDVRS